MRCWLTPGFSQWLSDALLCVTGYVALFALALGYPFALKWPRMSKYIKVSN